MQPTPSESNRLAQETSPYLLQHAHNPVDWFPWNEEALMKAKQEDKPILLSIGYSACHWCHVMAHESFEDEATAEVMNGRFINIKVDREERPDLDKIYQLSHQLLTRKAGGWPLTVFLNPHDLLPFFTGTYFPKEARYQLPAFVQLLEKVSEFYQQRKGELQQGREDFVAALDAMNGGQSVHSPLNPAVLARAKTALVGSFDAHFGGFGGAPKFPHPTNLEFLLRHHLRTGDTQSLEMVRFSLRRMAEGGIYDQLGGGFCRYSVDAEWNIPHFEKMLYDNGPLLALYSQSFQHTGDELFRRTAVETAEWAMREMQSETGGFYSSLDADSEGEEGKFYVWNRQEPKTLLSPEQHALLSLHYGLGETPNFEGHWHLYVALPLSECAARLNLSLQAAEQLLDTARTILFQTRAKRIWPGLDDKILTSWNALMIKGLAIAGRVFGREDFVDSAYKALNFLSANLYQDRLLATFKDGRARFPAYLDDHAFLLEAALELLQTRFEISALNLACRLADDLLSHFEDEVNGGFYFTAHDHENLIHRPKSLVDEAMPAGNGVAAYSLNRLGHWLGEQRYVNSAENALKAAASALSDYPQGFGSTLIALEEWAFPTQLIVLRGVKPELLAWQQTLQASYLPTRICLAIPSQLASPLPGLLEQRPAGEKPVTAYVCDAHSCLPPIDDLEKLNHLLNELG